MPEVYTMKDSIHVPATRIKTRTHKVLFTNDSPFKQKIVKSKMEYQRRTKHQTRDYD